MNNLTEPESEQVNVIPPSVAAGQRLREAREAQGLTRYDVARELRLQEKLIGALEEGDRGNLPPAAFISGYLRAYARLLNLPADQLVNDYLDERVTTSLYRATDRSGVKMPSSHDPKFRYTTYAVIAVMAILFAAWFANQHFAFVSLGPEQGAANESPAEEMEAALPEAMPLYQEPPVEEAAGEAGQTEGGVVPQTAAPLPTPTVTQAPAAPVAPAVAPVAPVATARTPAVTTPPIAPRVAEAKPVQQLPVVTTDKLSPSTPQSTLVLEFQAASWTQVEDAMGRMLVYSTIKPGRRLQLQGVAPFKVYLGYAPGVLVYYNGNLFSHAPYLRGDLARFRVGSSQDNRPLAR